MSKIADALRKKYPSPKAALEALGLDESLLKDKDEVVGDSNKELAMSKEAAVHKAIANRATTINGLHTYLKPRLAMDAKVSLAKALDGVTGKNFKAKKPSIVASIKAQAKGKLAQDANLDDVEKVLDMLEAHEVEEGTDESVSEAQHNAMEAAAHGNSTLGIPEKVGKEFVSKDAGMENLKGFLKEKGMADDDIMRACDMLPKTAMDADETDEEKKAREEKEKAAKDEAVKAEEDKKAADKAAKDAEMKDMVSKPAMDEAIKAAVEANAKTVKEEVRTTERAIRRAYEDVRPWVGELSSSLAFDSAADVYRHAAVMLGVKDAKTLPAEALPVIIGYVPKPGAKPSQQAEQLGMDAAAVDKIHKKFPGIERIGSA